MDDDLNSMGIDSSKEGYDESHVDDMKLGKKLWNFEYDVTIRLTQKVLTERLF